LKTIGATVLAATLLSGCTSVLERLAGPGLFADVSTGEMTAQISTRNCCGCMFKQPARAHVITLDAGQQYVVQGCSLGPSLLNVATDGVFGRGSQTEFRTFQFDAIADREYRLDDDCIRSVNDDVADADQVVACSPLLRGYLAHGSSDGGAMLIPIGTPSSVDSCWPSAGVAPDGSYRIHIVEVDIGATRIDASCARPGSESESVRVRAASFAFDAEAGHAYTFSGEDSVCMRLIDITAENSVIACEPYHDQPVE
jgi:hypothetical protein